MATPIPIIVTSPAELRSALSSAQPGDVIQLATATYSGEYTLSTPGVILEGLPGESPKFTGPPNPVAGEKPVWLKIAPAAQGALVRDLIFERLGDIADAKSFNDFGIVISAPDVLVDNCRLQGMTKGIQIEGKESRNSTIVHCQIGPTYQSGIVFATSYGVVRGALVAWNHLHDSYIEDGVQTLQDFDAPDKETDVSNYGVIIYGNVIDHCGENAIDLKGADLVVCEGNTITAIAGSNDGPTGGWQPDSPMSIMHGSGSCKGAVCQVLIRNNDVQQCAGGVRVFAGWHVVHNLIADNNFSKADTPHAGTGILQQGDETNAAIKNNLVSGHDGADLDLEADSPEFVNNPPFGGPGVELTTCRGAGQGLNLGVEDAGYFTDWFGRTDLPVDTLYLGGERYELRHVDYDTNIVTLDREAAWQAGDPVFWRSPQPVVGILPADEVEPPPDEIEPPPDEIEPPPAQAQTVTLKISITATPEQLQAIKEAVSVDIIYGDEGLPGIVEA